jgi:hypothetical protein
LGYPSASSSGTGTICAGSVCCDNSGCHG